MLLHLGQITLDPMQPGMDNISEEFYRKEMMKMMEQLQLQLTETLGGKEVQAWGVFRGRFTYSPEEFYKEVVLEKKGISIASTLTPKVQVGDVLVVVMGLEKGQRKNGVKEIPLGVIGLGVINNVHIQPKTERAVEVYRKVKEKYARVISVPTPFMERRRCGIVKGLISYIPKEHLNEILSELRLKGKGHEFLVLYRATETYFATPEPITTTLRRPFMRGLFKFSQEEFAELYDTLSFDYQASSILGSPEIYSPILGDILEYVRTVGKNEER